MKYILEEADIRYYNEIGQHKKIRFAFCNRKGNILKQIFHWVLCRDFLSDILVSEETKKEVAKYGFVYSPKKNKIDRDKTRLLLKFDNSEESKYLVQNLSILNTIEKNNRLVSTTIKYVKKDIYLVEGSKMWLNNTFSLHLYTFLLKVFSYEYQDKDCWLEELKQKNTNEGHYAKSFIPQFENIISKHIKKLFNRNISVHGYPKEYSYISFIHDNGGVQTLFRKEAPHFESTRNNEYYKRLVKILEKV